MKEDIKVKLQRWFQRLRINLRNFWRKYRINKLIILLGLITVFITSSYLVYLAKTADVENLKTGLQQTTVIYDRYGEEAGEFYSQKGTFVTIDEISTNIQEAVVSTEDKRFYTHKGVDPIGIGRAALGYIINRGNIVGGGSTLTQQLAKNAYLTLDQTLVRKAKELFLAFEIEKQYEKDEILEMYLNNSYFGNGVWGVEDASQKYFGKSASEVTLAEGAVLAAILKAPSYYNPIDEYEESIGRRDLILQLMADNGFIDQSTADAAISEDIYLNDTYASNSSYNYPYYFDAVIEEAINVYELDEEDILNKGYQIYTGLDQQYQQQMDYTYETAYFADAADGTLLQSASVAIEPSTGDVLAIVGGRGEHMFRGFNRATQASLPPASTIKPLAVYTPALEEGYEPDSMVLDDDTLTYGPTEYQMTNYDQYSMYGEIPMYQAIAESKNTTAAYLLDKLGIEKGIKQLEEFGIPVREEDRELGDIALGDMDGVSPLQMASAYATFANRGVQAEPRFITKIVDSTGAVIVDNTKPKTKRIVSEEVAKDMTSMLMEVYAPGGTGYGAHPYNGMLVAGKTGTSEAVGENGKYDRTKWMIAYTPDVSVATWIGFDESDEAYNVSDIGMMFYNLFSAEMGNLLSVSPQTEFTIASAGEADGEGNAVDWSDRINGIVDEVTEFGYKVEEKAIEFFDWANGLFN
ncbi:PBP1A family penicillin-binding protein [Jeotgalibaca caeni]|uniref:PBP1A family penicillin-binding protein n=1 Tax=Jeotgalibaca caeni TaxID=3028623 RepID=UPI00237EE8FB|nr:PBP1A family penicillin-binding protein [Jeotgalibaca caeni]MDE1548371.1 PBP1A family penicillin-binding protein [Jeotgalibaca caeni]